MSDTDDLATKVFAAFFLLVALAVGILLLVDTSPTEYLGHWAIDKKDYLTLSEVHDGPLPSAVVDIPDGHTARLLLPVDVKLRPTLDLFIWEWKIRAKNRGGIYKIGSEDVLIVWDGHCNFPIAIRKQGANLLLGFSDEQTCKYTPNRLEWVTLWSTKKKGGRP